MQVINGGLKNYEWGIPGGLSSWLVDPNDVQPSEPQAELWFGVHPSGASKIINSDVTLEQVLDRTDVPVLVKILAAAKPLSVQVHPHRELAYEGYTELNATEQFAGAFADPYEKIELLHALTPFTAFCGWRPLDQVLNILAALPLDVSEIYSPNMIHSRRALFEYFVGHKVPPETLDAIPRAVAEIGLPSGEVDAYATVASEYPGDQGALLAIFLQPISLAPGESVFIPAGMPHSYISGTGIEVMTSSDNVLRLGLTPKPIYAELALRALDFESPLPPAADAPFSVEVIEQSQELPTTVDLTTGQFRLVLALEGTTQALGTALAAGQAAVFTAGEPTVSISTTGRCAIVRTK